MADKLRDDLLAAGIIRKVQDCTEWVAPAKFVPKPGGKKVRLVTDYRRLNEAVERPGHPFPCATDILRSIKPSSRWFGKIDAVHSYFQVPLAASSQLLTTFLLPDGKYCYTCLLYTSPSPRDS